MSMGSHLVEGGKHSRGKPVHWLMKTLVVRRRGQGGSWRGTIRWKEDSGQLLRGTGWWLGASHAVNALAKEAEVQDKCPRESRRQSLGQKARQKPGLGRAACSVLPSAVPQGREEGPGRRELRKRPQCDSRVPDHAPISGAGTGPASQSFFAQMLTS